MGTFKFRWLVLRAMYYLAKRHGGLIHAEPMMKDLEKGIKDLEEQI